MVDAPGTAAPSFTGKVSAEHQRQGEWLRDAAEAFGDPSDVERLHDAVARFSALADEVSPEAFRVMAKQPGPPGDRELRNLMPREQQRAWDKFLGAESILHINLMSRLMFGSLRANGRPQSPAADLEWIHSRIWLHLKFDVDRNNTASGEGLKYWYVRVVDPIRLTTADAGQTAATAAQPKRARGSRVHGTNWREADMPLAQEMNQMLTSVPPIASNPWDAALRVSEKALGKGNGTSKAKRLHKLYSDTFRAGRDGKD
jgi:hypothetical protein